ncbi:MAG: lytic murein transglycosylase [Qingshengfaniella sp.]
MTLTRRAMTLGLAGTALAACSGAPHLSAPAQTPMQPVANSGYDAWVAGYRGRALARGIRPATFDAAFRGAGYLPDVIARDRNQTEFKRSLEDYLALIANDDRVAEGRAAFARHRSALTAIESRHGVDAKVVAGVWGVESRFGTRRGDIPVISAVSTLAYDGRRGAFFESQLDAALKILQEGDTTAAKMRGSWAGAMGHTQFIPTSYLAYAVDFDGDGRRDIWDEDPSDALASTAAYLARHGWQRGQPWGIEVRLPAGYSGPLGRGTTRSVAALTAAGVRDMDGQALRDHGSASVIAPDGRNGPAFVTFRNFTVLTRYNNSENYVIGVGHLADRIAGGGPIRGRFPPDAQGMTMADRQELQRRLTAVGFDTGGSDGVIGPASEAAISAYQRSRGMTVTGKASPSLLASLR